MNITAVGWCHKEIMQQAFALHINPFEAAGGCNCSQYFFSGHIVMNGQFLVYFTKLIMAQVEKWDRLEEDK